MIIKINGTQIKSPTALKAGTFRLSKSGRLASGKMTMDIIAIKRRIDLTWDVITAKNLNLIFTLTNNSAFYTIEFPDPTTDEQTTMTAYIGDINQDLFITNAARVWTNVTIPFIEQ